MCYLSVFVQKRQYCIYFSLIILDQPKANFRNIKVDWVLFKSTCFKLVNNSNEFHKSPFGGYFPLFADLHISKSQTNCFKLQNSPMDIYCCAAFRLFGTRSEKFSHKSQVWIFHIDVLFREYIRPRIQKYHSLNNLID